MRRVGREGEREGGREGRMDRVRVGFLTFSAANVEGDWSVYINEGS